MSDPKQPEHALDCIIQNPSPDCPVCNPSVSMPYHPTFNPLGEGQALSRCAVQQERDGRHAIFHSSECDGNRCGIELIELPSDHDPRAYDHLKGAGTLHLGPGVDSLPPSAQAELRAAAAGFTAEGTVKPCKMEPCEPASDYVTITPWSREEVAELQALIDADESEPPPLTVADLAALGDYIERTNHVDNLKHEARRLLAELKRIHAKVHERAEAIEGGVTTLPVPADGRTEWFTIASLGSHLAAVIDDKPYPYPEPGQDTGDFAREQLARAAAAALWMLVAHAARGGDDHHLKTFTEALINTDRLPSAVVEPFAPAFAQLLDAALPAIIASINPPDGPEVIA